jgi:hypothetical protein
MKQKGMALEIKLAVVEWLCGLAIGTLPLLMHAFLLAFVPTVPDRPDDWTVETLFLSITNSGLSILTAISGVVKGYPKKSPRCMILMVLTIFALVFSAAGYGLVAAGVAKDAILGAGFLSVTASIFFVIAIAKYEQSRVGMGPGPKSAMKNYGTRKSPAF